MISDLRLNLSAVPPSRREAVEYLAADLAQLAGPNLLALTLFGAFEPGAPPPVRSVAVFERVDLDMLHKLAERGPGLDRMAIAAPRIMTPADIAASCDTFPLELLEIYQSRCTVMGRDGFAGISLEHEHVRLQVEREFKRILIRMRQGLLATTGRDERLDRLVEDVAEHLMRTLRGLIWLKGQTTPQPRGAVLNEVERLVGGRLPGLRVASDPDHVHDWDEFVALYADMDRLARIADEAH